MLQDKLTEILGIEGFRVGDVVEHKYGETEFLYAQEKQIEVLKSFRKLTDSGDYEYAIITEDDTICCMEDDLKLISRDFTLAEVLMAFQIVRKFHTTLQITNKGYLEYWGMDDIIWQKDWDLTKTLFSQEQSTIDSISKIMGG